MSGLFVKNLTPEQIARVNAWADALESGHYQQAKFRLRHGNEFCCLGVACELSGAGEWSQMGSYAAGGEQDTKVVPPLVRDFFGLCAENGSFDSNGCGSALSQMNDNGSGFPEIAAIIRRELAEVAK